MVADAPPDVDDNTAPAVEVTSLFVVSSVKEVSFTEYVPSVPVVFTAYFAV